MKKRILSARLLVGLVFLSATLSMGLVSMVEARDVPGLQQIQRGAWQETTPLKSYTAYRRLCVDGLEFLSMEGYGWGQSSSASSQIIQVMDKTGKPKTCK